MTALLQPGPTKGWATAVAGEPAPGVSRGVAVGVAAAFLGAVQAGIAAGITVPFVTAGIGFLAVFVVPLVLVHQLLDRGRWRTGERATIAVVVTLLVLLAVGLLVNTVLPLAGVTRPLDTWPVLATCDVVDIALLAAAFRRIPARLVWRRPHLSGNGAICVTLAALTVPMAAMGAVRLNNGARPTLTLVTIALVMVVLITLFVWRDRLGPAVPPVALYCVSLALLFMTSLRGWYTTGHDVQHEMLVFLTTSHRGRWSPSLLHDGYNACLSLTVLPTMFLRWTRVSDPYVFKVFFQLLYAVCPVLVYQLGRRVASPVVGLVSAVYFIGFVGFVQDMPMLNRQEVAFLFFAAALLVLFLSEQADRTRRLGFCAFGAGMVVSHYSTSYFAAAAFVGLLVLRPVATRLLPRLRRTRSDGTTSSFPLTWWTVGLLLATVVVWNGPVNHTGSHLTASVTSAVRAALGHGGERAPETAYSVAGGSKKTTEAAAFDGLLAQERAVRDRHPDAFIPAPPPSATLTPLVPRQTMPATSLGRTLTGSADNARRLNRLWRTAAALGLQLLPAIGLLLVLLRRRWSGEVAVEAALLAVVTLVVLAAQVVLPVLSLDYGVARSFMQALMVLGPFVAIGTVALMQGPLARVRLGAAMAVSLVFFATTSGLVPQLLGSYGAQLHLNNSGDYYDRFYLHPEEVAALGWLDAAAIRSSPRYPDIQMDRDLFNKARSLGGVRAYDDIYPSDIHRDAYVVLGYPNVTTGRTLVPTSGFQLWLRYPENVLAASKSLVYTNGATRIYR